MHHLTKVFDHMRILYANAVPNRKNRTSSRGTPAVGSGIEAILPATEGVWLICAGVIERQNWATRDKR